MSDESLDQIVRCTHCNFFFIQGRWVRDVEMTIIFRNWYKHNEIFNHYCDKCHPGLLTEPYKDIIIEDGRIIEHYPVVLVDSDS